MPRPKKWRKVCSMPKLTEFAPVGAGFQPHAAVVMTVDEYESIRLIDHEGFSQEECAGYMKVARTTAQLIYNSARKKLSVSLVEGKPLIIHGGEYQLCDGNEPYCSCGGCHKHRKLLTTNTEIRRTKMKIAVTYESGEVFQHFGHTEQFKIYDVEDGSVKHSVVIDTNGSGHSALAGFLVANGVDTLICGGIGGGAQAALADAGIKLYGGVFGGADEAVNALLSGNLGYNPNVHCAHHDKQHGGSCGEHGCGGHEGHSGHDA